MARTKQSTGGIGPRAPLALGVYRVGPSVNVQAIVSSTGTVVVEDGVSELG